VDFTTYSKGNVWSIDWQPGHIRVYANGIPLQEFLPDSSFKVRARALLCRWRQPERPTACKCRRPCHWPLPWPCRGCSLHLPLAGRWVAVAPAGLEVVRRCQGC
jgi:hypothetical protein